MPFPEKSEHGQWPCIVVPMSCLTFSHLTPFPLLAPEIKQGSLQRKVDKDPSLTQRQSLKGQKDVCQKHLAQVPKHCKQFNSVPRRYPETQALLQPH